MPKITQYRVPNSYMLFHILEICKCVHLLSEFSLDVFWFGQAATHSSKLCLLDVNLEYLGN